MSLCYFRLLISLLRLPLEYISSFLHELKIYLYFVLIVYKVVDPCLNWYNFFYVLFRDKTLLGVSIDTKHNTPTEVVFCFSCVTGTFLGVCMVVAYVYYIHYYRHRIHRHSLPSTSFKDGVFVMISNTVFDNDKYDLRRAVSPPKSSNIEN